MYQALKKSHKLISALKEAQERTSDEMYDLIVMKEIHEHEVWEIVRERYVLLPSEDEVPHLGETTEYLYLY